MSTTEGGRPQLSLRVGVTGHRHLGTDPVVLRGIADRLRDALIGITRVAVDIGRTEGGSLYTGESPLMRLVSPLAQGTDQLVAALALEAGYELQAVLPFAEPSYRLDFDDRPDAESTALTAVMPASYAAASARLAFAALLEKVDDRVLELDGCRDEPHQRQLAYLAVGRAVVRHCDLLLAVWDGEPSGGIGGTGQIVEHALRDGTPVLCVTPAAEPAVRLLRSPPDEAPAASDEWELQLRDVMTRLMAAAPAAQDEHGTTGGAHGPPVTLDTYLAEHDTGLRTPGLVYRGLMRLLHESREAGAEPEHGPLNETEAFFRERHAWPDVLAIKYSEYYRTAYVTIFGLGALAITLAVVAVAFESVKFWATLVELVLLSGIAAVFLTERRCSWHRRWLSYRLLAELYRHARFLGLLGHVLPVHRSLIAARARGAEAEWVVRLFQAFARRVPLARTRLDAAWLEIVRQHIVRELIDGQLAYHRRTQQQSTAVDARLARWSSRLFLMTCIVVAVKFLDAIVHVLPTTIALTLGVMAAVLPTWAAAIFAVRHQSEFEAVASRSAIVVSELTELRRRIHAVPLGVPLASEHLGAAVLAVTELMMSDLGEWAVLFKVKQVETA